MIIIYKAGVDIIGHIPYSAIQSKWILFQSLKDSLRWVWLDCTFPLIFICTDVCKQHNAEIKKNVVLHKMILKKFKNYSNIFPRKHPQSIWDIESRITVSICLWSYSTSDVASSVWAYKNCFPVTNSEAAKRQKQFGSFSALWRQLYDKYKAVSSLIAVTSTH